MIRFSGLPMPFRDIAGHRHLFELLTAAVGRGTLPPSLIFAGPEGVGKKMAAMALAQLVNCQALPQSGVAETSAQPDMFGMIAEPVARHSPSVGSPAGGASATLEFDACGVCASCTRIARGVHADVLTIAPGETGAIKVDQVRDAIERAGYRPFEGRRRVVIIDEADRILAEAQNALLKTLEEPPSASMFVLVTSRPDLLLPTVQSRCQKLRFGRLEAGEIADVLITRHDYEPADAHAAASVADGSIGLALQGASDEFAEARDAAAGLLRGVAMASDPRRRLDSAKTLLGASSDREELSRRLRALSSLLRDLGVLLARADHRWLANADLQPFLSGLVKAFDGDRTDRAFSAVDRALAALDRNASPKIVADWLAFQI
jgi:DNA polymerase-3 subunit delta'